MINICISLFIILLIQSAVYGADYDIEVLHEGTIELTPGKYTPIKVKFTSLSSSYLSYQTKITLQSEYMISLLQEYEIDLSKSLVYWIYIGVPSSTSVSKESTISGSFITLSQTDKFNSKSFQASVKDSVQVVNIQISGEDFSSKSYGVLFIDTELYNMEPVVFTVEADNKNCVTNHLEIPAFSGLAYENRYITAKFYWDDKAIQGTWTLHLTIKTESKWYKPENESAMKINFKDSLGLSDVTKDVDINDTQETANEIQISFDSWAVNTMLSCMILPKEANDPEDEEIINQRLLSEEELKTKRFFNRFQTSDTIVTYNVLGWDSTKDYKLNCIYQNNAQEKDEIKINEISKPFDISSNQFLLPSAQVHCADWFIKSYKNTSREEVINKLYQHCLDTLYNLDYFWTTDTLEKGCLHCEIRDASSFFEANKDWYTDVISICLRGSSTCSSKLKDADTCYDEFYDGVQTAEQIQNTLGLDIELHSSVTENDIVYDYRDFSMLFVDHEQTNLVFKITNNIGLPLACNYTISGQLVDIPIIILDKEVIVKAGMKDYEFKPEFNENVKDYDNDMHGLFMSCRPVPGIPETQSSTSFTFEFVHMNIKEECKKEILTIKNKIVCWDYTVTQLPNLNHGLPIKDQTKEINQMKNGNMFTWTAIFQMKMAEIGIAEDYISKWKLLTEMTELFQYYRCDMLTYDSCQTSKQMYVLTFFSYLNTEEDPIKEESPENIAWILKYKSLILFYLVNSPDSFEKSWVKLLEAFAVNLWTTPNDIDKAESKQLNDIYRLIPSFVANTKQWYSYFTVQGLITGSNRTMFLNEGFATSIRKSLVVFLYRISKFSLSLDYETVKFSTKLLHTTDVTSTFNFPEFNFNVTIPLDMLKQADDGKVYSIGAIAYKKNPYVWYNSTSYDSRYIEVYVYNEQGEEVTIDNWSTEHNDNSGQFIISYNISGLNSPILTAGESKDQSFYCYRYDEKDVIIVEGIVTEYVEGDDALVKCYSNNIGNILIGKLEGIKSETRVVKSEKKIKFVLIISIIIIIVLMSILIVMFTFSRKQKEKVRNGSINVEAVSKFDINETEFSKSLLSEGEGKGEQ